MTDEQLCSDWNDEHDCRLPRYHPGDHACGGWDAWNDSPGPLGCGDVWNRGDCDHDLLDEHDRDYFVWQRDSEWPEDERCITPHVNDAQSPRLRPQRGVFTTPTGLQGQSA